MSITIEVLKPETICAKEKPPTGQTRRQYLRVRATSDSATPEDLHLSLSQSFTPDDLPTGWTVVGMPSATTIHEAAPEVERTWEVYIQLADTVEVGEFYPTFGNKYGLSGEETFDETDGATAFKTFRIVEYLSGLDTIRVENVKSLRVIDGQAVEVLEWYELANPAMDPSSLLPNGALLPTAIINQDDNEGLNLLPTDAGGLLAGPGAGPTSTGQYLVTLNGKITLTAAENESIQTVLTVYAARSWAPTQRRIIAILRLYPSETGAFGGALFDTYSAEGRYTDLGVTVSQGATISYDVEISALRLGYVIPLTSI